MVLREQLLFASYVIRLKHENEVTCNGYLKTYYARIVEQNSAHKEQQYYGRNTEEDGKERLPKKELEVREWSE